MEEEGQRMTQAQGRKTETLKHSGNIREWGHRIIISYFSTQAYQKKAQHPAHCQLQSV